MIQCSFCSHKSKTISQAQDHERSHTVKFVSSDPLTVILELPDGCAPGRWEAAQAFSKAIEELRTKYPDKEFDLVPFSFSGVATELGSGPSSSLTSGVSSYLAIAKPFRTGIRSC